MTSEKFDALGDRLKSIEQVEAGRRFEPGKPIIARLDGRAFHTFTRGLKRPYDTRLSSLMANTAAFIVENTHASLGYTQSDEISLFWKPPVHDENSEGQLFFGGKIQKLTSVLASLATSYFVKHLDVLPEKEHLYPTFDCRVWQVDDIREVYLNFMWRQDDAVKNSISMAAQAHFSHTRLHGVGSEEKKKMLREIGYAWEDMPEFFKSGTFVKRIQKMMDLTPEQLSKIPEQHRPSGPVLRSVVEEIQVGMFRENPDVMKIFD